MTSVRTLATSAKLLRAESDRRIAALHNAEAAAKVADAPFDSHINAITKAKHLANAAFYAEVEAARKVALPCVTCGRPTIHRNYLNAFDDQGMPQCNPCYDGSPE